MNVSLYLKSFFLTACALLIAPASSPAQETEPRGSVELVLDASGSMAKPDANGQTRIEAAREALGGLITELPEGAPVGLRVYGNASSKPEVRRSCEETTLVQPVGPLEPDELSGQLDQFEPGGKTAIGLALKDAAADLPDEGEQVIVLVSDGLDTCAPPDPCDVAKNLASKGVDLRVQAIGLQVDPKARAALECIAKATGGVYRSAEDAESLADSLLAATLRALRSYSPTGEPVTGGDTPDEAALLAEGQFVDSTTLNAGRWYAVDVPPGTGFVASATLVPPLPRIDIDVSTGSTASIASELFGPLPGAAEEGELADPGATSTDDPGAEEVDSGFEAGLIRNLAAGQPTTVSVSTGGVVEEAGRYVFLIGVEERVEDGLPDQEYPLELLVDQVGTPIDSEEEADETDPSEAAGEEASSNDGISVAVGLGVGFGGALLGFVLAAVARRRGR